MAELSGRMSTYSYDSLYRFTAETITDAVAGNHASTYQYDPVGNCVYHMVNGVQIAYQYDDRPHRLVILFFRGAS